VGLGPVLVLVFAGLVLVLVLVALILVLVLAGLVLVLVLVALILVLVLVLVGPVLVNITGFNVSSISLLGLLEHLVNNADIASVLQRITQIYLQHEPLPSCRRFTYSASCN